MQLQREWLSYFGGRTDEQCPICWTRSRVVEARGRTGRRADTGREREQREDESESMAVQFSSPACQNRRKVAEDDDGAIT
jgi:hypothetical protein